MPQLNRIQREDLSGGVQTRTNEALMLNRQVKHAFNAEFSTKLGSITGRKGSLVQSTVVATQKVLNMLKWIKNDGTVKYFAVSDDGAGIPKVDIYINSLSSFAGTWAKSLQDWTTILPIYGENFVNKLMVFNGVDAPVAWDGSTWTAITNAPVTGLYPVVFNQKLYVLDAKGFLHYSDVTNATGTDFTTTTWLNRGINPNDGQVARGAIRHRGRIVILKDESIYRYDGSNEPEASITVGTHSHNSIVLLNNIFFHHPTGIYQMGVGDPINISRAVKKYLDGMSSANWANVSGGRDLENLYMWIGDVTINDPLEHDFGRTYTDVVLVYNVYANVWTVYSNWNARVWFYDELNGETYFGTSEGKIVKINTGYSETDGSTVNKIHFEVIFTPENAHYPEKEKEFNQVFILGRYESDVLVGDSYIDMTTREKITNQEGVMNEKVTCKELWVGVSEEYSDTPPRIDGIIIDKINLLNNAQ